MKTFIDEITLLFRAIYYVTLTAIFALLGALVPVCLVLIVLILLGVI